MYLCITSDPLTSPRSRAQRGRVRNAAATGDPFSSSARLHACKRLRQWFIDLFPHPSFPHLPLLFWDARTHHLLVVITFRALRATWQLHPFSRELGIMVILSLYCPCSGGSPNPLVREHVFVCLLRGRTGGITRPRCRAHADTPPC